MLFAGFRTFPRPRHELPRRVLFLLSPFFRYCDWREAWVLRIVGERYGPVLRAAPSREPGAEAVPAEGRSISLTAIHLSPKLLVAIGVLVAAVLGFLVARSASGGSSTPSLGRPVPAGALEVALPGGWQVRPAHTLLGPGITDGVIAVSGSRSIAVGTATTTDPSLLPASILGTLRERPTPQLVKLGATTFDRYSQLPLRAGRVTESAYAVPTLSGTALVVCRSPKADAGFASMCEQVTRTMNLRSGSLSPGLVPSFASILTKAIGRLNTARTRWGAKLNAANMELLEARAARRLAAAHARAAAALVGLDSGPAWSENAALVEALRSAQGAYAAIARAATRGEAAAYRRAAASVSQANLALSSALAGLRSFGYPVR